MAYQKIKEEHLPIIKALYTKGMLPFNAIAQRLSVSRQTVAVALRKMGVDTSKRQIVLNCNECGELVSKTRAEVRKHEHHFCNHACYSKWMKRPETQAAIREAEVLHDNVSVNHLLEPGAALYYCAATDDVYVFCSREQLLTWKRTGVAEEVGSTKLRKMVNVEYSS